MPAQWCPTLCDPVDCSLPGSSVRVVSQARILSGLPFPPPGDLPDLGIKPQSSVSPALAGGFFTVPSYMGSHSSALILCLPRAWLYLLFSLSQESGFQIHISNLLSPTWRLPVDHQPAAAAAKSLQLCRSLCDPIDGSPPGSSVHGIVQARVLEWGAIAFSPPTS